MHYEINVSRNGQHVFATHPRSLTTRKGLTELLRLFNQKFPSNEGFEISAACCPNQVETLNVAEILRTGKV